MIAQSPGQVIQAMRLALTNNTIARLTREDLRLPAGFTMERRLPQMRQSDEDPVQSLLGQADDWNYTTIERSSDQRLGQFQESLSHMLQNAVDQMKQHMANVLRSGAEAAGGTSAQSSAQPMKAKSEGSQPVLNTGAASEIPKELSARDQAERPLNELFPNIELTAPLTKTPVPPPSQPPPPQPKDDDMAGTKTEGEGESDQAAADVEMDDARDAEAPRRPTPEVARSAEAPPPEGLAPSSASLMPEQSTPLSGMRGVTVDISDVRENQQVNAAYDPKSCPIQSEKIPITTIYRPDLMPDRAEGSIAPIVEYDMDSAPVSLPKFDVPGLNAEVDDSIRGRAVAATCLPPSDRQRKYSRRRVGTIAANQLQCLRVALDKVPPHASESFLRPETYDSCQPIADANDAFKTDARSVRSIRGEEVVCYRLANEKARVIRTSAVPDTAMVDLVKRLMFRAITQAKEYSPIGTNATRAEQNDHEKGIPVYSYYDRNGIVPFDLIAGYMEREKQIMRANAGEKGGKILLQAPMIHRDRVITDDVMACVLEVARADLNRFFEFFYSSIDDDHIPQFVGVRAIFGFGPDSVGRFRQMTASQDGPFVHLAKDTSGSRAQRRPREVAQNFPSYGWGCATMREFMGFITDSKIAAPKGQLFLTLLPHPPNCDANNSWEEVYLEARRNPGRDCNSRHEANANFPKARDLTD